MSPCSSNATPASPERASPASARRWGLSGLLVLAVAACGVSGAGRQAATAEERKPAAFPRETFRDFTLVNEYPHDPDAYTQGLFLQDGFLYEGTGRYGESTVRRVELATGRVLDSASLPSRYFGEGIALLNGRIYQLTWRARKGFIYSAADLEPRGSFRYPTEGWGLTTDGTHLILSDGTATLYFLDPESFETLRSLEVRNARGPVPMLNELEWVEGVILANVWQQDVIVEVDPSTGTVRRELDFGPLVAREGRQGPDAVLNGIAYDPGTRRLFVTGKLWSRVYEVELTGGTPGPRASP